MTASELFRCQFKDTGFQIDKVLEGFPQDALDQKTHPQGLTVRETVAHLCECCAATVANAKGESHNWGTFHVPSDNWDDLMSTFHDWRAKALEAAVSDESKIAAASSFTVIHDGYHIGQLCGLRLTLQPDWDNYSIYSHD